MCYEKVQRGHDYFRYGRVIRPTVLGCVMKLKLVRDPKRRRMADELVDRVYYMSDAELDSLVVEVASHKGESSKLGRLADALIKAGNYEV